MNHALNHRNVIVHAFEYLVTITIVVLIQEISQRLGWHQEFIDIQENGDTVVAVQCPIVTNACAQICGDEVLAATFGVLHLGAYIGDIEAAQPLTFLPIG